jgi:hypothetical protein
MSGFPFDSGVRADSDLLAISPDSILEHGCVELAQRREAGWVLWLLYAMVYGDSRKLNVRVTDKGFIRFAAEKA